MNSSEFGAYKTRYRRAIQQVLAESEPGRLDETGFPAYSHANPLINWLFWKRIHTVMNYVERSAPYENVLDFGCGSGVMLPFLASVSKKVVAADIDLLPLENMKKHIPLAPTVSIQDASKGALAQLPAASFDLIVALDVLEHVEDLSGTLSELLRLLMRGGQLVISGPTESNLYHFGRRLAGPEYSGVYHERGISEVRRMLVQRAKLKDIATLYWPVPLFEIFTAIAQDKTDL
jgi:2-polyprenyl-3-methyl-5-hydroxy-6-metoxy-1,4-benzoquinol methylase